MNEIIRNLYENDINPDFSDSSFTDDHEIMGRKLDETFTDNQKELFDSYTAARRRYESEIAFYNFSYGYKTACKLVIEGLS